jgi:hypothetical protein
MADKIRVADGNHVATGRANEAFARQGKHGSGFMPRNTVRISDLIHVEPR